MTPLTLIINGAAVPLPADGSALPKMWPRSRGITTFTLDFPGKDPGSVPSIGGVACPFGAAVSVMATLPAGPVTIFSGTRTQWHGLANPDAAGSDFIFSDALFLAARTTFQHYWNFTPPGGGPVVQEYFARINLFQNITANVNVPWSYFTMGQQLTQIVAYMAASGIPIQIGRIDPSIASQIYNLQGAKGITCLDAMLKCLQATPDIVTQMDYTQNPPMLNFISRGQTGTAGQIALPYSGTDAAGRMHKTTDIKDRPDLVPSQVVIQYQTTYDLDGVETVYSFNDVYPPGSQGDAPFAEVTPVDLTGETLLTEDVTVHAAPFNPALIAFWLNYKPDLSDPERINQATIALVNTNINDGSYAAIKITDETTGQLLSPSDLASLPNILLPDGGAIASWMVLPGTNTAAAARKVIVSGTLSYQVVKDLFQNPAEPLFTTLAQHDAHPCQVRLVLTNSPADVNGLGTTYVDVTKYVQPEFPPTGLAEYFYNSMRPTPWEGKHVVAENNISQIITPGNLLNLTNAGLANQAADVAFNAAWATMNAAIVDVEIDFFYGRTTITFGPHKHLTVHEWFDWIMFWRWRVSFNYSTRQTGSIGAGGSVNTSGNIARENTTAGTPQKSLDTLLGIQPDGTINQVQNSATDPAGGKLVIQTLLPGGNPNPAAPSISMAAGDIGSLNGSGRNAAFRLMTVCKTVNGIPVSPVQYQQCYVLCTAPEAIT